MLTFRPSAQPNACRPFWKAAMRGGRVGSISDMAVSTPMRRSRSDCCARAAIGHAAAPPSSVMNSRRRIIRSPRRRARAALVDQAHGSRAIVHADRGATPRRQWSSASRTAVK